jgi:group I intron endonuclease
MLNTKTERWVKKTRVAKFSCVYKIYLAGDDRVYYGKCRYFKGRKGGHLWLLRKGLHASSSLQEAFDRYGESNFRAEILEKYEADEPEQTLLDREQSYIDSNFDGDTPLGYNVSKSAFYGGGDWFCGKRGEEHPGFGKPKSKECRRKMSEAKKGAKCYLYGKHLSEDTKAKLRAKSVAWWSDPENKAREVAKKIGRRHSEASKKKASEKLKGRKMSAETRRKMSEARKKRSRT